MDKFHSLSFSSSFCLCRQPLNRLNKNSRRQVVRWTWNNFQLIWQSKEERVISERKLICFRVLMKSLSLPIKLCPSKSLAVRRNLQKNNSSISNTQFRSFCGTMNSINSTLMIVDVLVPLISLWVLSFISHLKSSRLTWNISVSQVSQIYYTMTKLHWTSS